MRNRYILSAAMVLAAYVAYAQGDSTTVVSGKVSAGLSTHINSDQDLADYYFTAVDPRLGTGSGNHYASEVDDDSRNVQANYGAELNIDFGQRHRLALNIEGEHEYERALGTRSETLTTREGKPISHVSGAYNHPNELTNHIAAGADYTYRMRRPGEALTLGYSYLWDSEQTGFEHRVTDASGWARYQSNVLEQNIRTQVHHAHIDYVVPVSKGHLLDFGLAYDQRDIRVHTQQEWDEVSITDADYRHLTRYGGIHARYRLRLGPVEAMARLEYRATRMQQRWLHDVLPTATIRYQIDSVHSLSAFYTIVLIRPEVQHLDTTTIADAYSRSFGSDDNVGVHVHNTALTYRMHLAKADCSAEVRYLTANDGFNAIWMERDGMRIYTWGNAGVRHAVSLTPRVASAISPTTHLQAAATVMWDKRIADAINLANANWSISADMQIDQRLLRRRGSRHTWGLNLLLNGRYAYHNTLDVYSYAGHGGQAAGQLLLTADRSLRLSLGYNCLFRPDVHIIQGAYSGTTIYRPGATHVLAMHVVYSF